MRYEEMSSKKSAFYYRSPLYFVIRHLLKTCHQCYEKVRVFLFANAVVGTLSDNVRRSSFRRAKIFMRLLSECRHFKVHICQALGATDVSFTVMLLDLFFVILATRYPDTPGADQFADFRRFRDSHADRFNGIMTMSIVPACRWPVPANAG